MLSTSQEEFSLYPQNNYNYLMDTKSHNNKLFQKVKELNLPSGEYAITSSGSMGVRNLRKINDVDIITTKELWDQLIKKFPAIKNEFLAKINLAENIDVLYSGSYYREYEPNDPTVYDQIKNADIIDELPFIRLETVLYLKKKYTRDKDIKDIELIENYLKENYIS